MRVTIEKSSSCKRFLCRFMWHFARPIQGYLNVPNIPSREKVGLVSSQLRTVVQICKNAYFGEPFLPLYASNTGLRHTVVTGADRTTRMRRETGTLARWCALGPQWDTPSEGRTSPSAKCVPGLPSRLRAVGDPHNPGPRDAPWQEKNNGACFMENGLACQELWPDETSKMTVISRKCTTASEISCFHSANSRGHLYTNDAA